MISHVVSPSYGEEEAAGEPMGYLVITKQGAHRPLWSRPTTSTVPISSIAKTCGSQKPSRRTADSARAYWEVLDGVTIEAGEIPFMQAFIDERGRRFAAAAAAEQHLKLTHPDLDG